MVASRSNSGSISSTNSVDTPAVYLELARQLTVYAGSQTLRVQAALRDAILSGSIPSGAKLPPTRTLAEWLRVPRHAIVGAYESLQGDGLVVARVGAGSFVAPGLPLSRATIPSSLSTSIAAPPSGPFALGVPMVDPEFQQRVAAAVRRHALRADIQTLGYGDPRGSARLREAIAREVMQSRGVRCSPDQVVVTAGTQQVLRLCAQALMQPGDAVWMEDPGYPAARRTLTAAGLRPLGAAVDGEGIAALAEPGGLGAARAVYVTPSHQFPTGVVMSLSRRLALLDWAHRHRAWILEDDYDSEFRYRGAPLTALAGLDRSERVVYIGTFSKSAFPALRLAYAVMPVAAMDTVLAARGTFDRFTPPMLELALADLIEDGSLARHLRRARLQCQRSRDLLVRVLAASSGGRLTMTPPDQGLHLLAWLPVGVDTQTAKQIRDESGLAFTLLSEARLTTRNDAREALILGFSGFQAAEIERAGELLGATVASRLASTT